MCPRAAASSPRPAQHCTAPTSSAPMLTSTEMATWGSWTTDKRSQRAARSGQHGKSTGSSSDVAQVPGELVTSSSARVWENSGFPSKQWYPWEAEAPVLAWVRTMHTHITCSLSSSFSPQSERPWRPCSSSSAVDLGGQLLFWPICIILNDKKQGACGWVADPKGRSWRKPCWLGVKRIHQPGHEPLGTHSVAMEGIFSTWKKSVMST